MTRAWKNSKFGVRGTLAAQKAYFSLRDHRAVVTVIYDTKSYSIKYKDSSNLNYDGKSIHKNYNGWVENLDKAIRSNLVSI